MCYCKYWILILSFGIFSCSNIQNIPNDKLNLIREAILRNHEVLDRGITNLQFAKRTDKHAAAILRLYAKDSCFLSKLLSEVEIKVKLTLYLNTGAFEKDEYVLTHKQLTALNKSKSNYLLHIYPFSKSIYVGYIEKKDSPYMSTYNYKFYVVFNEEKIECLRVYNIVGL